MFYEKKLTLSSSLLIAYTLLVGCGGGSDSDSNSGNDSSSSANPSSGTATITINSFNIIGTSAKNSDGKIPVNAAENNGKWSIDFELSLKNNSGGSNGYLAELLLDKSGSGWSEGYIADIYCNGEECVGKTKVSLSCTYEHADPGTPPPCEITTVSGGSGATTANFNLFQNYDYFDSQDLRSFFSSLPANGYIFLTAESEQDMSLDVSRIAAKRLPIVFE